MTWSLAECISYALMFPLLLSFELRFMIARFSVVMFIASPSGSSRINSSSNSLQALSTTALAFLFSSSVLINVISNFLRSLSVLLVRDLNPENLKTARAVLFQRSHLEK